MALLLEQTIEDVIRQYVPFVSNAKGWNKVYCAYCGDGSRKKGPRGGWLFDNEVCFYHCFNCGVEANFDPNREVACSKHMRDVFDKFSIPKEIYTAIIYNKKLNKNNNKVVGKTESKTKTIPIPDHFYKLSDADIDNLIAIKAKEYLLSRHVDPDSYPFYLSTGIGDKDNGEDILLAKSLRNRIIIPSFKGEYMVYYQARSLDPESKMPYVNSNVPRGNIIYGYDKLKLDTTAPLFITEGFFDAYHVKGVCVLENNITTKQIEILNKSNRKKVVIPDRNGDSNKLAEQALSLGWAISILDKKVVGSCKDVDEAVSKYGKLVVLDNLMKNIKEGSIARGFLNFL